MPRPIKAVIDVAALRHNLANMMQRVGAPDARSRVWAVIKANAYGHGIEAATTAFAAADGLALLDLEEAVRARASGWDKPILLLEGAFEVSDLAAAREHKLTLVVHAPEQLDMLERHPGAALDVHLKLDTGMTRLGFGVKDASQAIKRACALKAAGGIGELALMTHFACADQDHGIDAPLAQFVRMANTPVDAWCLSNSAACLLHAKLVADTAQAQPLWSRPGICLYGASPLADVSAQDLGLLPAMRLCSELIGVRDIGAGQGVGYGHTFVASAPMRIGVVACGYADGYPRHAPTGTPISVAGHMTRTLGRVSMDMIMVDLTGVGKAGIGAPVVLFGAGGPSVDAVAQAAGTIGYELLSAVTARVPRRVVGA